MRKLLTYIIIFVFIFAPISVAKADSLDETTSGTGGVEDLYKDVQTMENGFGAQKQITDEDFEKTYQKLKSKKDKKLKKNQPFKGKDMKSNDAGTYLQETAEKNMLLGLPVNTITPNGDEIPVGHYRIDAEKVNGKVYFKFYQGYTCVATVQGTETNNDWNQKTINFVQLIPYNENYIELIYGSVDFNAYTFLTIKGGISGQ